jgi:hypothetical protein
VHAPRSRITTRCHDMPRYLKNGFKILQIDRLRIVGQVIKAKKEIDDVYHWDVEDGCTEEKTGRKVRR